MEEVLLCQFGLAGGSAPLWFGDFVSEDSSNPLYLIGDHLGSTSLVIDTSGQEVAKRSYMPFGETLGVSATELPTDYTYTGQREAAEIGLKYYIARWYDSEIGHFIQADTIVPGAGNPLAWNRYAYVEYNPIRYTDPTGHMVDEEGSYNPWKKTVRTDDGIIELPLVSVTELVGKQSLVEPVVTTIPVDQSLYPGSWPIPNNDKPPIDLSDYTMIESGPLMVSIFIETGYGYGPQGYNVGIGLVSNFEHDYLYWWTGRSTGFDIGSSWCIGIEMSNEDNIDNYLGPDAGYYFGGSVNDVGFTAASSPTLDSFSFAFSPGLRLGYGYQIVESQLLWQID